MAARPRGMGLGRILPDGGTRRLPAADPWAVLLLVLSLLALTPLVAPGYFYSAHDGRHSVFYVVMFDESLRSGALWPRWAMHHAQGYGYPTFVLQAPLAFYVAEIFVLLGVGITNAVKIAWALGFLWGALGAYTLARRWVQELAPKAELRAWAPAAGLVAGLLFTFIPYHLVDIYVRAALAETMMLAWLPWAVWAFDRLIGEGMAPGWQGRLSLAALSLAAVLLTHVFALLAFVPLLAGFVLFRIGLAGWMARRQSGNRPWHRLARITGLAAAAGIAGLLLTAAFLFPLVVDGPFVDQQRWIQETYDFHRHWVYLGQFLSPYWGYGFSDDPTGANDTLGFQLGAMAVILGLVGLQRILRPQAWTAWRALLAFLIAATLAVVLSMTPWAAWLWETVSVLAVIQFPWRLMTLTTLTMALLGGLVVVDLVGETADDRSRLAGVLVMALLVVYASYGYARPAALQPIEPWREDGRAVAEFEATYPDMLGYTSQTRERFTTSPMTEQYLDFQGEFDPDRLARLAILAGDGRILEQYSRGQRFGGVVEMATPGTVQIRVYDFPGWQVRVDGRPVPHRTSPPYGLIEVDVPAGRHRIDLVMGWTPARAVGMALSGITLLGLVGLWLWGRRRQPSL